MRKPIRYLLLALCSLPGMLNAQFCLDYTDNLSLGGETFAITSDDLNADGYDDLVVAQRAGSAIHVLLSNGDGTFIDAATYSAANRLRTVGTADFNSDGYPDVFAAGDFSFVWVLMNQGNGTLVPATDTMWTSSSWYEFAVAGYFDNDNVPDIALVNQVGEELHVLLGKANGGAWNYQVYPLWANRCYWLIQEDFNEDGETDIAGVCLGAPGQSTTGVSLLTGRGNGTFNPPQFKYTYPEPHSGYVTDYNQDGKPDLQLGTTGINMVRVPGNGDGTFGIQEWDSTVNPDRIIYGIDLNLDGRKDLVRMDAGGMTIFRAKAGGHFPSQYFPSDPGNQTARLCTGDFNGDGKPDIAMTNWEIMSTLVGTVDVWLNCSVVSREDAKPERNLRLYPNPIAERATLELQSGLRGEAEILDLSGHRVRDLGQVQGTVPLDLSGLASGMYGLRLLTAENEVHTLRFVKL